MSAGGHSFWEVVGGADRGGLLVREGPGTESPALGERLATGALVRELALDGQRLRYSLLAGRGPASGWVSTRLAGPPERDLLVRAAEVWVVVGGGDKGGILAREGHDIASDALPIRLSTGAFVQRLAAEGGRLNFRLLHGTGPASGWVSTRAGGKDLLVRADLHQTSVPSPAGSSPPEGEVIGDNATSSSGGKPTPDGLGPDASRDAQPRKLRVLAMCGSLSCRDMIKLQTGHLMAALGRASAEWTHVEGNFIHPWEFAAPLLTDVERKVAEKKGRITSWYDDIYHCSKQRPTFEKQFDPSVRVESVDIPKRVRELRDLIEREGPFDVVVGFSQSCIMLHYLIGHLRKESEPMPWKLTVFFEGMHIRDEAYFDLFAPSLGKLAHPTVHVFGRASQFYAYAREGWCGSAKAEDYYESPLVLEHDEGHNFPVQQPRAKEIYDAIVSEIRRWCAG